MEPAQPTVPNTPPAEMPKPPPAEPPVASQPAPTPPAPLTPPIPTPAQSGGGFMTKLLGLLVAEAAGLILSGVSLGSIILVTSLVGGVNAVNNPGFMFLVAVNILVWAIVMFFVSIIKA